VLAFASSGNGWEVHGKTRVYYYDPSSNIWEQKGLNINEKTDNTDMSDEVSLSMSKDGNILAVGSSRNSIAGQHSGRARVFKYLDGTWAELGQHLYGSNALELFGKSVALGSDGNSLAVGAEGSNGNKGSVQVFTFDSTQWVQVGASIHGQSMNAYSGTSVAISSMEDTMLVAIGSYGDNDFTGSVNIFQYKTSGNWVQVGDSINGAGASHFLGSSVAMSSDGKMVVVGAPSSNYNGQDSGSVYVYQLSDATCSPTSSPTLAPSSSPSNTPTVSELPSSSPSANPSNSPSHAPSLQFSGHPSKMQSSEPSTQPSSEPSSLGSNEPSLHSSGQPSIMHSSEPTTQLSSEPSRLGSDEPSLLPSDQPSDVPSHQPSGQPSTIPSDEPSLSPSRQPSTMPSDEPSLSPSGQPSLLPSSEPSTFPSTIPSEEPSLLPSDRPSTIPSDEPSVSPSRQPSMLPSSEPSLLPSGQPSNVASVTPSSQPSKIPSRNPSNGPSWDASKSPSSQPTASATIAIQNSSTGTVEITVETSCGTSAKISSAFMMGMSTLLVLVITFA